MHIAVTHMLSDGYSIVPLMRGWAQLVALAEERALDTLHALLSSSAGGSLRLDALLLVVLVVTWKDGGDDSGEVLLRQRGLLVSGIKEDLVGRPHRSHGHEPPAELGWTAGKIGLRLCNGSFV